jgi:hypothetical protein
VQRVRAFAALLMAIHSSSRPRMMPAMAIRIVAVSALMRGGFVLLGELGVARFSRNGLCQVPARRYERRVGALAGRRAGQIMRLVGCRGKKKPSHGGRSWASCFGQQGTLAPDQVLTRARSRLCCARMSGASTTFALRFISDSLSGTVEHTTSEFDNFRKNSAFEIHGRTARRMFAAVGVTGWEF